MCKKTADEVYSPEEVTTKMLHLISQLRGEERRAELHAECVAQVRNLGEREREREREREEREREAEKG